MMRFRRWLHRNCIQHEGILFYEKDGAKAWWNPDLSHGYTLDLNTHGDSVLTVRPPEPPKRWEDFA